jgi:hypothetical protein
MIFLALSRQMSGEYFKLGHDHFYAQPYPLSFNHSLIIVMFDYIIWAIERIVKRINIYVINKQTNK